ncbi:MAG: LamG-like jellyroll fold domain-containing protein, partial [Phycisphaerae bacterium]
SYIPPEGVEMEQNYYWRIDEFNTDGTISTGDVWNFTVPNYLIVDDMESYTDDVGSRIFQTWIDGFGFTEPAPGNPGNNTGSTVGNTAAPFAEQTIINSGIQSMPFDYSNVTLPFYSETDRTFDIPQDWTRHGVKSLTLWFRGYPISVSSFTEEPPGTYTLAVRSPGNISGTSDEFLFAYKQLNGLGSIIAKVEWVKDADDNAQAGIMIRETLDPNSAHAAVLLETNDIAADADLRFRCRTATGQGSTTTTVDGIMAPQWLKLDRLMGDTFRAYYSTDGANWVEIGSPQTVSIAADVYVGLVVASENAGVTCEAEFSNVTITGTVTGQWQSQDIGINNNDPESVYVAITNSGGTPAVVYYEDPDEPDAIPTQFGGWTQWNIDLKQFADKGVNLAAVKKMFIGVGDRGNPQLGGTGTLYVDDIRLYVPRCLPDLVQPAADLSNNCIVDHPDLEIMTADWLKSDYVVSTVAPDPAGLVAHYTFDGNASDSSGNNYHGIEKGGPAYVDGKFGQAINLDGFDDYVAIPDVNYTGTDYSEVTVCAWVRTTDNSGQIATFDRSENWRLEIGDFAGGAGLVGWEVWTSTGQEDTEMLDNGWPANTRRINDGQWHHVTGVFDNGTMTIYIDGNPEQPYLGGATFGRGRYTRYGFLGCGSEASYPPPTGRQTGAYLEGDLDEVYIYHRVLTPAEIAYLADETPGDGELYIAVPSAANLYDEEPILSKSVNFRDIAVLVGQWLDEQLWP